MSDGHVAGERLRAARSGDRARATLLTRLAALWFAVVLGLVWLAAARRGVQARRRDDLRA
jgi:hypothetical protein